MWFNTKKLALIVAIPVAVFGFPNIAFAADEPKQLPTLEIDMRNTPPGESTTSSITISAGEYIQPNGETMRLPAETTFQCTGRTHDPHWSRGTRGVIAKTVVSCSGPDSTIPVRVESLLGRTSQDSVSSLQIVAESNYVQHVPVGVLGAPKTWYVPEENAPRISGDAYFRASHSVAAVPPMKTEIMGSGQSNFVYVPNQ